MNLLSPIGHFLSLVNRWAASQTGLKAVALVGSYARGTAKPESDVDLIILTESPDRYIQKTHWARQFGEIERQQVEDWGRVKSLRIWYTGGLEVEFGFTAPDWAALPLDAGTRRVIEDGMRVLYDIEGLLTLYAD